MLPFVLMAGATMFVFTWLNTQRLRNEYRANRLVSEIERINDRIGDLRGAGYDLGSLERMEEAAPQHALVDPRPGQIQTLRVTPGELTALYRDSIETPAASRMTRSVVIRLDGPGAAGGPAGQDKAVARGAPPSGAGAPLGHF
jgi:hypothetical protein